MAYVAHALIPVLWILWLAGWILASYSASETQRRESLASRVSHYIPFFLGGICLAVPNALGGWMEREFHGQATAWLWAANVLAVLGLGFATWARAWLGRNWSAEVTVKQAHELIRSGPYALVRHPIYTGLLLALIGTALFVDKWRALVGVALIAAAFVRKIVIEERFMTEQFGDAYRRYRAQVAALIPFLI